MIGRFVRWLKEKLHRCQREGCWKKGNPCYYPPHGEPDDDVPVWVCCEHMKVEGFCVGCGGFWAGVESFDFGPGWCDNCAPEWEEPFDEDYDNADEEYYRWVESQQEE